MDALASVTLDCMTNGSAIADEVKRVLLFAGQSDLVGADGRADRIDDYSNFKGVGYRKSSSARTSSCWANRWSTST